jgi:hypothetical protein
VERRKEKKTERLQKAVKDGGKNYTNPPVYIDNQFPISFAKSHHLPCHNKGNSNSNFRTKGNKVSPFFKELSQMALFQGSISDSPGSRDYLRWPCFKGTGTSPGTFAALFQINITSLD